jgi:hypothetical protein
MQPLNLRPLRFLDLIPTGTTDSNSIEYVQVQAIPGTPGRSRRARSSRRPV